MGTFAQYSKDGDEIWKDTGTPRAIESMVYVGAGLFIGHYVSSISLFRIEGQTVYEVSAAGINVLNNPNSTVDCIGWDGYRLHVAYYQSFLTPTFPPSTNYVYHVGINTLDLGTAVNKMVWDDNVDNNSGSKGLHLRGFAFDGQYQWCCNSQGANIQRWVFDSGQTRAERENKFGTATTHRDMCFDTKNSDLIWIVRATATPKVRHISKRSNLNNKPAFTPTFTPTAICDDGQYLYLAA